MRDGRIQHCLQAAMAGVSAVMLLFAAAAACLLRGLFFDGEMYLFLTIWYVMSALFLGLWLAAARLRGTSGTLLRVIAKSSALPAAAALVLLCPLAILALHGIHWLRGPLSAQGTLNELLRWGMYAGFAFLAYYYAGSRNGARLLTACWNLVGIVICLSALLAVCGGLPLPYAIAYSASPEVSVTGARLGGIFQYPNAFGAVMAVFLLERLFAVAGCWPAAVSGQIRRNVKEHRWDAVQRIRTRAAVLSLANAEEGSEDSKGSKNRHEATEQDVSPGQAVQEQIKDKPAALGDAQMLIHMLPLFPYAAALLLSESRGALLSAACAAAAFLLWKRRFFVPLLVAGAAPAAAAALLYRQLARTGLAVEPLPGLLLLAGCWAGALLAGLWACRRCSCAAGYGRAAVPTLAAAGWTAAGTAVLLQVRERITGPSPTAAARGLFYRDAWKLAAEAPWLGRGGETWRSSYLAAQSRPYAGSQVHSGYLDFLLNLGIVGLALLLLLLLAAGWVVAAASPRLLPSMLVLALHGAVDFDWSYGLVWLLLFLLPALALAEARQQAGGSFVLQKRLPAAAAPVCLGCLCVLLALFSFQAMKGRSLYMQAMRSPEPARQLALLRKSLDWNPRDPKAVLSAARYLQGREAIELLQSSLIYAPENAAVNWELAERYIDGGEPGEALYWIRRSLRLDHFNALKREKAVKGMLEMGRQRRSAGDEAGGTASAAAGLELLRQFRLLAEIDGRKGLQHNDRRFTFTKNAEEMELQLRKAVSEAAYSRK